MKNIRFFLVLTLILFSGTFFSGCAWFQDAEEKSDQELVGEGMEAYEAGKYRKAIESFEKLKDWYPFSKYAILAELKIADAFYHLGEYEESIYVYEEFESLHPKNEAVPYVVYQIGNAYFKRMDSIDRDQTAVKKALETFTRLIRQYPDDVYAAKARIHVKECHRSLAGHELYVGIYYFMNKQYKPAAQRFRTVITRYPDTGIHAQAIQYLERCEKELAED